MNKDSIQLSKMVEELADWLKKYDLDQVDQFRFLLRDISHLMLHCVTIVDTAHDSDTDSTDPDSPMFCGLTDEDARQLYRVSTLLSLAVDELSELHDRSL